MPARLHWTEYYVGRWNDMDCVSFVQLVLHEQFGCKISLPAAANAEISGDVPQELRAAATTRARDKQVVQISGDFIRALEPRETTTDGDCVMMRAAGT